MQGLHSTALTSALHHLRLSQTSTPIRTFSTTPLLHVKRPQKAFPFTLPVIGPDGRPREPTYEDAEMRREVKRKRKKLTEKRGMVAMLPELARRQEGEGSRGNSSGWARGWKGKGERPERYGGQKQETQRSHGGDGGYQRGDVRQMTGRYHGDSIGLGESSRRFQEGREGRYGGESNARGVRDGPRKIGGFGMSNTASSSIPREAWRRSDDSRSNTTSSSFGSPNAPRRPFPSRERDHYGSSRNISAWSDTPSSDVSPPPLDSLIPSLQHSETSSASTAKWEPTKKLTFAAMAGLRALHDSDPKLNNRAALSEKFGISFEAVGRILRSRWQRPEGDGAGVQVGDAGERGPRGWVERPEDLSPIPAIQRAMVQRNISPR